MTRFVLILAAVAFVGLVAIPAQAACYQTNNQLGLVGLDAGNGRVYAAVTSSSNQCGCTHVNFRPSNTDTNKALTILLAAKLSGKKVRMDILNAADCNSGYRVYMQ